MSRIVSSWVINQRIKLLSDEHKYVLNKRYGIKIDKVPLTFTQKQLSKKLGMSDQRVNAIEKSAVDILFTLTHEELQCAKRRSNRS